MIATVCEFCGKTFEAKTSGRRFCSRECAARAESKRHARISPTSAGASRTLRRLRAGVRGKRLAALEIARLEYQLELERAAAIDQAAQADPSILTSRTAVLAGAQRLRAAEHYSELLALSEQDGDAGSQIIVQWSPAVRTDTAPQPDPPDGPGKVG